MVSGRLLTVVSGKFLIANEVSAENTSALIDVKSETEDPPTSAFKSETELASNVTILFAVLAFPYRDDNAGHGTLLTVFRTAILDLEKIYL